MQNRVRRALSGAMTVIGLAMTLLVAADARATTPKTLRYQDSDGAGQIFISEFAPDPATGGQRIQVRLTQNGRTYSGTGFQLLIHEDPPNQTDRASIYLVTFTLRDPFGRPFLFRGRLQTGGIAGRLLGSGRYEQAGVGSDVDQWTITE